MASFRKKGRIWYYRFVDAEGVKRERRGCPDRRVTEEMARAAESEAAKVREGLTDPKAEAYRRHEARPLAEHLNDFHAHLIAEGHTHKHAGMSLERVRRVVGLIMGGRLAEIAPPRRTKQSERGRFTDRLATLVESARLAHLIRDRVQGALAILKDAGLSLQSVNHHRAACRAFTRWAWKDGRLRDDALVGVAGFNAKEDRRHDRRTLGLVELRLLIEAAHNGPTYRLMSGPARALCYRLAVATGLRYSEIKSVTPTSFDLDPGSPTVTVAAGYTKNGKPAVLPLPRDVAVDLASYVATIAAGEPVFHLPEKGAEMLRVDLEAAGIPYRDAGGLVFDFHALRCQCATLADQAGVTPRVVQRLMRHSTLELTGRYTRPRMHDIEGATAALPTLRPTPPGSEAMAATGTEGQHISSSFSPHLPTGGDGSGNILTATDGKEGSTVASSMGCKSLELEALDASGRDLTAADGSTPERIRTSNLRFRRPMTESGNSDSSKDLRLSPSSVAPHLPTEPDLALIVERWADLPEAIRAGIVAMVRSATGSPAFPTKPTKRRDG